MSRSLPVQQVSLSVVLRGLQLLSVLLKATKEEAGVHKFDTLSLAKTLTDLPSQQTLDLAILCQAFGAGLAAHVHFCSVLVASLTISIGAVQPVLPKRMCEGKTKLETLC